MLQTRDLPLLPLEAARVSPLVLIQDWPSLTAFIALTLVFARGTGEMGTMGTVIGPPLATALANALGDDKVSVSRARPRSMR